MSKQPKILIIEDEIALVEVLQDKLENNDFVVEVAHNGEEGLKKACESGVDLILLDIIMPHMDGMTMLRHLRKDKKKQTPVIVLTNLGSKDDAKETLAAGANDFLIKADNELEQIVDRVKEFLKV